MFEVTHMEQNTGEKPKFKFVDIYVKDRAEALTVDTARLIQGSKLFIIETTDLYVLNEDEGVWYHATDGTVLA